MNRTLGLALLLCVGCTTLTLRRDIHGESVEIWGEDARRFQTMKEREPELHAERCAYWERCATDVQTLPELTAVNTTTESSTFIRFVKDERDRVCAN